VCGPGQPAGTQQQPDRAGDADSEKPSSGEDMSHVVDVLDTSDGALGTVKTSSGTRKFPLWAELLRRFVV
jgi:hypothetical protein